MFIPITLTVYSLTHFLDPPCFQRVWLPNQLPSLPHHGGIQPSRFVSQYKPFLPKVTLCQDILSHLENNQLRGLIFCSIWLLNPSSYSQTPVHAQISHTSSHIHVFVLLLLHHRGLKWGNFFFWYGE